MLSMIVANTAVMAFAVLMAWAAWRDVASYTVPNWISAALIGLWILAAPFLDLGWQGAGLSVAAFAIALAVGFGVWSMGWLGGGDVKILAAGALWFGWPDALTFVLYATLIGGGLSLLLLGLRHLVPLTRLPSSFVTGTPLAFDAPVPYAVAIGAATLIYLPDSTLFGVFVP